MNDDGKRGFGQQSVRLLLTVGYMTLILASSMVPKGLEDGPFVFANYINSVIQNALHVPMYGILAILLMRLPGKHRSTGWKIGAVVVTICVGFGIVNELVQLFVPGRYAGLLDVGLNAAGATVGVGGYLLFARPNLEKRHLEN